MKIWLRRIHLGLALISGLFLLIVSLTGAVMIYAKDIQHLIEPAKWQVAPQATFMHYDELIQNVQTQTKQKITFFMPEQAPDAAWQFRLANKHYASVNP